MVDVIRYEELTYPDVAYLPRDLPLLIPLGDAGGYDWDAIAAQVRRRSRGRVDRLCVFPAVPFGFATGERSLQPLAVEAAIRRRVLASLIASVKEDGFRRVFVVNGHGPQGFPSTAVPLLTARWRADGPAVRWPPAVGRSRRIALIATGHTEQHAFHLPLNTDTLIIGAIAQGVEQAIPAEVFRLPTWPFGVSMHRRQFPGTTTVDPRAWEDFWVAVVGRLRARGFRMVYFVNGHGGNHSFLVNITKFCGDRWPDLFAATAFLHTSSGPGADAVAKYRTSRIGGMGHAGELETSYILHLRPELVRMQYAADEIDFTATPNYYMDWIEGGALIANPPWTDDTVTGAYGAATHGTADKGRRWLQAAIEEKVGHVREIQEQHRRRSERREEGWVAGAWRRHPKLPSHP